MRRSIFAGLIFVCVLFANHAISSEIILSPMKSTQPRKAPWIDSPGQFEQSFPLFLAAKPKDLAFGRGFDQKTLLLPASLKELGTKQFRGLIQVLDQKNQFDHKKIEFLIWPSIDVDGQYNWVVAQWRTASDKPWHWLDLSQITRQENTYYKDRKRRPSLDSVMPILAQKYHPYKSKNDYKDVFADFLDFSGPGSLYQKSSFGDCVWVESETGKIVEAWLKPGFSQQDRELKKERIVSEAIVPYCLPQPPFAGDKQIAFIFSNDWDFKSAYGFEMQWYENPSESIKPLEKDLIIAKQDWGEDYSKRFHKDVRIFSGEAPIELIKNGKKVEVTFDKKGSYEPDNKLEEMVDYLEIRYHALKIKTYRQRFKWRGIKQSNLIAVIKGKNSSPENPKIILADHIDTAVAEDTYDKTGKRVTVMGASDNVTATATLLRAAEILRNYTPDTDVLLLHLTGEEFPSDGLGAWHFLSEALQEGDSPVNSLKIKAAIIPDFIGHNHDQKYKFQINPTFSGESIRLARLALDAGQKMLPKKNHAPIFEIVYRPRHHPTNGVFNTDVMEFEYMGIPGLLFNEYLDYSSNNLRKQDPHNHQSHDVPMNVDYPYATEISKVVIETTIRAANLL